MSITVHRITQDIHVAGMWAGTGARDFGGRWNSKGFAVVYTAESLSLAALELLVHLDRPRVLTGFVTATVTLPSRPAIRRVAVSALPVGWDGPVPPPSIRQIGDDWIAAASAVALAVPSAVTPCEWNYMLNPAHPAFAGLVKSAPAPFAFDGRLR